MFVLLGSQDNTKVIFQTHKTGTEALGLELETFWSRAQRANLLSHSPAPPAETMIRSRPCPYHHPVFVPYRRWTPKCLSRKRGRALVQWVDLSGYARLITPIHVLQLCSATQAQKWPINSKIWQIVINVKVKDFNKVCRDSTKSP